MAEKNNKKMGTNFNVSLKTTFFFETRIYQDYLLSQILKTKPLFLASG